MIGGSYGTGTSSSSDGTVTVGPCRSGTSSSPKRMASPSSGGTVTVRPCGTGTSSFGGTMTTGSYGTGTSSSPTHMCFTLGASTTPNGSFIISNVICKNCSIPTSYTK
jgi:hypothetical protein